MITLEIQQGSKEWIEARAGIPTASNFDRIITTQGKQSTQRQKYLYQLAGERIIGVPEESYTNVAMQRGQQLEDEARQLYQIIEDEIVEQVGFCTSDGYGCSPDGIIGKDGGLEIKCPGLSKHVEYLLKGELPTDYYQQVQGNLLVTGREWWSFMSYFPTMKPLIIRVGRDEKFINTLKTELAIFCEELEETVNQLKDK